MHKPILVCLLLLAAGGCGATVYPEAHPSHPEAVYVANYGIHSSLLLPNGDGRYVEYAFGDWNFAALNHCWPNDALGALLISFQSALGRRYITVTPENPIPQATHPSPHSVQVVYATREEVAKVVHELDERYRKQDRLIKYNPDNLMYYVKDSEHYSVANNCNHLTARCLREMGCEVHGFVVLSNFTVVPMQNGIVEQPLQTAVTHYPATMPSASRD